MAVDVPHGAEMLVGGRTGLLVRGRHVFSPGNTYNWTSDFPTDRNWLFDLATATAYGTNISAGVSTNILA